MELVQKSFNELTSLELYKIMQLRARVFVVEQNCVYDDIDDKDLKSQHIFYKENDNIVAYTRALPKGLSYESASFGRVSTDKEFRGQKLGAKVVDSTIKYIFDIMNEDKITIGAQDYVRKFYSMFGFKEIGELYDDDGIDHMRMVLTKEDYQNYSKIIK